MDGLFLVDKPSGLTSHDVVARIRRRLGGAKTGHFGTLDPLATGLLIVAAGKAVRLNPFYASLDKAYEGRIRLGIATDTYDAEGVPAGEPAAVLPPPEAVAAAVRRLTGPLDQVPPPFSAKKLAGRPLYSYARKGRTVEARPVRVVIREFTAVPAEPPDLLFSVRCSSGTYIRSLAHDLGQALGCGAYLAGLRRTAVGDFRIEDARTLEGLEEALAAGAGKDLIIPLDLLLTDIPAVALDAEGREFVRNGRTLPPARFVSGTVSLSAASENSGVVRLIDPDGHLVGLAKTGEMSGSLTPHLVFIADEEPRAI
jgi:tRNA pseudouridine55 synthase